MERKYKKNSRSHYSEMSFKEYIKENNNVRIALSFILPILVIVIFIAVIAVPKINESAEQEKEAKVKMGDIYNAEITAFANAHDIDYEEYPDSLIALFYRNRETREFVLHYPLLKDERVKVDLSEYENSETIPLFMQWDTRWGYMEYGDDVAGLTGCGPVCLSMCAYYLTGDESYSPDKMLEFSINEGYCVYGNGTSWELFSKGASDLGFDVTEINLDNERIINNIKVGNPIVCIMGPGDFTTTGHFIVLSGYDDETGLIKVNDPNSIKNSEKLWDLDDIKDQIRNIWVIRNIPEE